MRKGGCGIFLGRPPAPFPKMRAVPGCPEMRSRGFGQRDRWNDSWVFCLASLLPMTGQCTHSTSTELATDTQQRLSLGQTQRAL